MKPRKVTLTIEVLTDAAIKDLRKKERIQLQVKTDAGIQSLKVDQIEVMVIQKK